MQIIINGEARDFAGEMSLADLLQSLGMKADRVAVELNRAIARRESWAQTTVHEGDRLEIVHFVGGGSAAIE
jgi:thiamine biosynthesis protein ThiS